MPSATMQFSRVSLSFGRREILAGASFAVPPGLKVGIVGENGCGKTTLVEIALGLREPDSGSIWRSESARLIHEEIAAKTPRRK